MKTFKNYKTLFILKNLLILFSIVVSFIFSSCTKDIYRRVAVNTKVVSAVTGNTATVSGRIIDEGEEGATQHGHCWDKSSTPTIEKSKTELGSSSNRKDFTSNLTNLTPGTKYYVRAYATDKHENNKTVYGSEINFTTSADTQIIVIPLVSTNAITSITQTTAVCGGNITSDGNASVTSRGVCWNTSTSPTVSNSHTTDGIGTGTFTSNISGLTASITYYVRAYATNSMGTAYGNEVSFTAGQSITTPILSTTAASSITQTTATSGGIVTTDGGASVTTRGVCWSTSQNPVATGNHTTDGTGTGSFISTITGLSPSTLYYVKAYATNSAGTSYGSQISFNTSATTVVPTVTTTAASSIAQTTATSGGNVTSDGGATVTARGVCWSTSQSPVVTDSHTTDGTGTGAYTSSLTNLIANTMYYVRAYATNTAGTSYGNEINFTTSSATSCPTTVIDFDGNTYNTVLIGTQCWMRENLKTIHYSNGSAMLDGSSAGDISGQYTSKYYFDYDNTPSNTAIYGKLYTWAAVMNGVVSSAANPSGVQGVCPTGWHVPSDAEWTQLTNYLGGTSVAGGKMKEVGTAHWYSPNTGADNNSGFTGLPSGVRYSGGSFGNVWLSGYSWSATENSGTDSWLRNLEYSVTNVNIDYLPKSDGHSVRCIKD